jgi:ABC-2 type transport system ATP-binding protein
VASTRRQLGVVRQALGFANTLKVAELVAGAAVRAGKPRSAAGPVPAELDPPDLAGRRGEALRRSGATAAARHGAGRRAAVAGAGRTDRGTGRAGSQEVLAERRERGTGVLLTTHLIEESSAVADRVVLDRGRVVAQGTPARLVARLPDRTVIARTALARVRLEALPGSPTWSPRCAGCTPANAWWHRNSRWRRGTARTR